MIIIVNPAAGGGRCGQEWSALARRLHDAGLSFTVLMTRRPGDGSRLARRALLDGATTVIAVGGDGTINEVINGFLQEDRPLIPAARLGIIPAGAGNDLARALGLSRPGALLALVSGDMVRDLDVVRVQFLTPDDQPGQRYYLLHAAVGIVAEATGLRPPPLLRRLGGRLVYTGMGILAILRHRPHDVTYQLDAGGMETARLSTIVIANGCSMGGGMRVAPDALLDDGRLDVITLRAVSRWQLLSQIMPGLYDGEYLKHPAASYQRLRCLSIDGDEPLLLELDGDVVGHTPARFDLLPGILPLLLPTPGEARAWS